MNANENGLGQIAYAAYGERRQWKTMTGEPMKRWPDVPVPVQEAWEAAGLAVAASLVTEDQASVLALLQDPQRLREASRTLQQAHAVTLSLQRLAAGVPAPQRG